MTRLIRRLRRPQQTDIVTVTLTGAPAAVTALARTLAAVTDVTGMRHTTTDTGADAAPVIRIVVSCAPRNLRRAA